MSDPAPSSADLAARERAIDFLLSRINYEKSPALPFDHRRLKLDRMRSLLARVGNPDRGLPIVHVAGTKGKGSTSAFVARILREAGYDVGVFSSPHLESIEERFAVNDELCGPAEFASLVDELRPTVHAMDAEAAASDDRSLRLTFFELITAVALLHFKRRKVDLAVLEVGLGGRLDSTNICQPAVTAITCIDYDHMKQLGETLPEIAAEKAGIVKPGVPLVVGPLEPSAYEVIARIARERGARMVEPERDYRFSYEEPAAGSPWFGAGRLRYEPVTGAGHGLAGAPLGLCGEHQAANATVAVAIVDELTRQGWLASQESVERGLAATTLPGRLEVARTEPTVVLDVAHNVASIAALVKFVDRAPADMPRRLLFAATRDKDVRGMIRELAPAFPRAWLAEYQEASRAVPVAELAAMWREETAALGLVSPPSIVATEADALAAWQAIVGDAGPDELICATGSFFLIAQLRPAIRATPHAAPSRCV
ncbi:MAG: bifunctional folylpolyglutamate synthase/dihydrofolate synthase [Pirellulales bacterium]|nr:bifunctional folylpolyglutamate synthase/dihydrofolate synthase [Pirellulales bacterium]